jgi:hypothetical protein
MMTISPVATIAAEKKKVNMSDLDRSRVPLLCLMKISAAAANIKKA